MNYETFCARIAGEAEELHGRFRCHGMWSSKHPGTARVRLTDLGGYNAPVLKIPAKVKNDYGNLVFVDRISDRILRQDAALTDLAIPPTCRLDPIDLQTMFHGCFRLERLTWSRETTFVPVGAFRDCVNLKEIYFEGSEEEWRSIVVVKERLEKDPKQPLGLHATILRKPIPGNEPLLNAFIHFHCNPVLLYPNDGGIYDV